METNDSARTDCAEGRPRVTQAMNDAGLRRLGLGEGDVVLVHSSLSSFGTVEGGADAVIDALLGVIGPSGTLCMPTLTWGSFGPDHPPPLFDPRTSKGIVGRIPEVFRQRPRVQRSLHPTHSVAALGPEAERLLEGHEYSRTPCGLETPWGRMRDLDGYVLMIGCGTAPMTMSHGAEEVHHEDARCTPPVRCLTRAGDGETVEVSIRLHQRYLRPGPSRLDLEPVMEAEEMLKRTRVGKSNLLLARARDVWDVFSRWCRENPGRAAPKEDG